MVRHFVSFIFLFSPDPKRKIEKQLPFWPILVDVGKYTPIKKNTSSH